MFGLSRNFLGALHMAEYELDGWTVPNLINPDDVSLIPKKR